MSAILDDIAARATSPRLRVERCRDALRQVGQGHLADARSPRERAMAFRSFELPRPMAAAWQVANTLLPYLGTLVLMGWTIERHWSWWTTLALAVPASGLLVRLFVLMHDCTHASFLHSRRAERVLGSILGVLAFTPFAEWRHCHLAHHATSGDLDRRGTGDIWTMTVDEYFGSSPARRLQYRYARNPFLLLLFGPFLVFVFGSRIPPRGANRERVLSVLWTDLALAAIVTAAAFTIGVRAYVMIQLPVLFLAGVWGIWLFYVQHQFVPSYWARGDAWEPTRAALEGSSYLRLPKVLQWFSANIGLHHVHHRRPRIPNYNLQRCLDATPEFRLSPPLTLIGSVGCAHLALWDERAHELVSFRGAEARRVETGKAS